MIHETLKYLNINHPGSFEGISTDTRTLKPDNLFFALTGPHFDGHDYLHEAQEKGAIAAVIQDAPECLQKLPPSLPCLLVPDVMRALGEVAHDWRKRFNLPLIAVTGSNGKTTTKNMLKIIFETAVGVDHVLATRGNLNNHIGVPLMLSELQALHHYAVIEMGMNHLGEIDYLSRLAEPTTAIITNAGPCHLEGVGGTIAGVARAKGEIFTGLLPTGMAIINLDDAFAPYWINLIKQTKPEAKILTFGMKNSQADVTGEMICGGFILRYQNSEINIALQLLGIHNIANALAASAAALANHVSQDVIKAALEKLTPAAGRMEMKQARAGVMVLDDTYNANPLSLDAALATLKDMEGFAHKILVLGDMRELGLEAKNLHAEAGMRARAAGVEYLFALGELSAEAAKSFKADIKADITEKASHFADHESLIEALNQLIHQLELNRKLNNNILILIKGSRSMKMEQVVHALLS